MSPEASGMLYTTVACMQSTAAAKAYLGVEFQRHWWPELHAITLPFSLRDDLHHVTTPSMFRATGASD